MGVNGGGVCVCKGEREWRERQCVGVSGRGECVRGRMSGSEWRIRQCVRGSGEGG